MALGVDFNVERLGYVSSLAVSTEMPLKEVNLSLFRDFTIAAKASYAAGTTSACRVLLYWSPDGVNYDTVAYAYFDITLTANTTVQESHSIDMPPSGYMRISVKNQDSGQVNTAVQLWMSYARWGDEYLSLDKTKIRRELGELKGFSEEEVEGKGVIA
jgi:hypothetical protein